MFRLDIVGDVNVNTETVLERSIYLCWYDFHVGIYIVNIQNSVR